MFKMTGEGARRLKRAGEGILCLGFDGLTAGLPLIVEGELFVSCLMQAEMYE
jgi:hypothetical protein